MPSYSPVYPPAQPGQPTDPSQPLYGQPGAYPPPGQPGPYSQPLYGQPGQPGPYSQPLPGQPGPYSQPLYGQPGPYSQPLQAPPAQPKRSLRWLWITLAIVLVVGLLLGGGGFFAFANYTAPATAAGKYCGYLKAQNYDSAYGMLSSKLKGQYSSEQFRQASTALDNAEGKVTACGAGSGSNAYKYTLFGNTATVLATTTREKQGLLQGEIGLVNNDGWKVDSLATSLIGINLGALDTLGKFCQAYQTQNYSDAYALLDSSLKTGTTADEYASLQKLQDQVDGNVTACALEGITSATDDGAKVQISLTRSTLGKRAGEVGLIASGTSWLISNFADDLQGTDLIPLVNGATFCLAAFLGQYDAAFALLSDSAKAEIKTAAGLAPYFTSGTGAKVTLCAPEPSTLKVTGAEAQVDMTLSVLSSSGATGKGTMTVFLIQDATNQWKVDGWKFS
jgi:hypothetical protein